MSQGARSGSAGRAGSAVKGASLKLLRRVGIDRAIGFALLSQGWTVLSGPLNLFFVVKFLSKTEQGFYYTFAQLLGLQVFFHLGLGLVLVQFVSHEKAFLDWTGEGTLQPRADTLEAGERAKARLSALVRLAFKWYGAVSLAFALVVPLAGFFFFSRYQTPGVSVAWLWPWLFISLVEAANLLASPYYSVVEGCGLVAQISKVGLWQNVASSLLFWLVLALGGKLWGTTVAGGIGLVFGWTWLMLAKRGLFIDLWHFGHGNKTVKTGSAKDDPATQVDWKREIWPLQWKIGLSWLSSYFIFSLFNPTAFAYSGPVAAGRLGMSLSIASALWAMSFSWMSTKSAPMGMIVAAKNWKALDALFFPALWQSAALLASAAACLWTLTFFLQQTGNHYATRIMEPLPLALLLGATLANHIVGGMGLYLRAHKQEPFVVVSLLSGGLIALSNFVLGRFFGVTGMMTGYLLVSLGVGLTMGGWIFQQKRREWHSPDALPLNAPAPPL